MDAEGGRDGLAEAAGEVELKITLDTPMRALPAGSRTSVFCSGTCSHPRSEVLQLFIETPEGSHPVAATGMPRPGFAEYRSGFWTTFPLAAPPAPGIVKLRLRAVLADGTEAAGPLGEIQITERPEPVPGPAAATGGDLVAICMATYNPDPELFRRQVESLRNQTHPSWVCLISDDHSDTVAFSRIEGEIAGDERFIASRSPERLGFYRNFERAMQMAPRSAAFIALCDQDDFWYPDKVSALVSALREDGSELAYSDQRLVDSEGGVISETFWTGRRNNWTSLGSMLVANTVTGAAALFRREVADDALPFPDQPGWQFHDHWIALIALARGSVTYVDRPLYDYVQHAGAILGQVAVEESGDEAGSKDDAGNRRGRPRLRGALRDSLAGGRAVYFCGYLRLKVQAETVLLRCSERLTAGKRGTLERFAAAERTATGAGWLALRPLRGLLGRSETLASEHQLLKGIAWRRTIEARARRREGGGGAVPDASMPPCGPDSFGQKRLRRWRARN